MADNYSLWSALKNRLNEIGEGFDEGFVNGVKVAFSPSVKLAQDTVNDFADALYRDPVNYLDAVSDRFDEVVDAFDKGVGNGLDVAFSPSVELVQNAANDFADALYRDPVNYLDAVSDRFDEVVDAFDKGVVNGLDVAFSPAIEMAVETYNEYVQPIIDDIRDDFVKEPPAEADAPTSESLKSLKKKFDDKYAGVDLSSDVALQAAYLAAFSADSTDSQRLYGLKDLSYAVGNGKLGLEGSDRQLQFDFLDYALNNFESSDNKSVYKQVVRDHAEVSRLLGKEPRNDIAESNAAPEPTNFDKLSLVIKETNDGRAFFHFKDEEGNIVNDSSPEMEKFAFDFADDLRELTGDERGYIFSTDHNAIHISMEKYERHREAIMDKYDVQLPMSKEFTDSELNDLGVERKIQIQEVSESKVDGVHSRSITFMGKDGVADTQFVDKFTEDATLSGTGVDKLVGAVVAELPSLENGTKDGYVSLKHAGIIDLSTSGLAANIATIVGKENFTLRGSANTIDNYIDIPVAEFEKNMDKLSELGIDMSNFGIDDQELDEEMQAGLDELENSEILQTAVANLGKSPSVEIDLEQVAQNDATFKIDNIA